MMAKPIAVAENVAFAFPDVCRTPSPSGTVPLPYPNVAQLAQAQPTSATGGAPVFAGGKAVLLANSVVATSSGDEAGTGGGVRSNVITGACTMDGGASASVFVHGQGVVRFGDPTRQNRAGPNGTDNATGQVLSAFATVLVGD
jgi:hypothetical protein